MWETCLKHSSEIITLILGSGILGYLFSKWFGFTAKDDTMNVEYETQINSLNNRLRNQDAELKNVHSIHSSWAAEKTGLLAKIDDLSEAVDVVKNSFAGYVSPAEYQALQSRFDQDMKLASDKIEALSNEKLHLLSNLESKTKNQTSDLEEKLKKAEAQLLAATNAHADLAAKLSADLEATSNQIIDLQNQLSDANSDSSEVHDEIAGYKSSIENLKNALKAAEDQIALRDKEYLSKLSNTEADLTTTKKALAEAASKLNQTDEANQAEMAKLIEANARIHQVENELTQVRAQAQLQKEKNAELEKLTAALAESDRKAKEWEARWKDAATDADQFKVAHSNLLRENNTLIQSISQLETRQAVSSSESDRQIQEWETKWKELSEQTENVKLAQANALKERDSLKQRINQLESEVISASNQIEQIQHSNDTEWNGRISDLNSKLNHAAMELQSWQNKSETLLSEIENQKAHTQEANVRLLETNKQFEAQLSTAEILSHRINELENLVGIRENELIAVHNQLAEAHSKVSSLHSAESNLAQQLAEVENRYRDITNRFNTVQTHLSDLQKSANSSAQQVMNLEALNKELNERTNAIQFELNEAHQANDTGNRHLQGVEAQNREFLQQIQSLSEQIENHKASENTAKQIQESTDNKYKELAVKFNTVQLQLADELRSKSHLEESIAKKTDDINHKYQSELTIWQKRIKDLEKDFSNKEVIYKSKIDKLESTPPVIIEKIVEKRVEVPKIVEKIVNPQAAALVPKVELPAIIPIANKKAKIIAAKPVKAIRSPESISAVGQPKTIVPATSTDWKSVSATFGKKIKPDDHILIEGIGPKINAWLKKSKITSWSQLAASPVQDIQNILDKGGNKFSLANPASWPKQASLAAQGKWDDLKKFQLSLIANRKLKAKTKAVIKPLSKPLAKSKTKPKVKSAPSVKQVVKKAKSKAPLKPVLKKTKSIDLTKGATVFGKKFKEDDFKVIEGIGPKIDRLLKKAGIKTWKKLGQTETKFIQNILDKAGNNFTLADPKTWPKQSSLAAEGAWEKLKKMQDGLK